MTYRIFENRDGTFVITSESGCLVSTSAGEPFITSDKAEAEEALKFLNQPLIGMAPRQGSHRMKSIFGPL